MSPSSVGRGRSCGSGKRRVSKRNIQVNRSWAELEAGSTRCFVPLESGVVHSISLILSDAVHRIMFTPGLKSGPGRNDPAHVLLSSIVDSIISNQHWWKSSLPELWPWGMKPSKLSLQGQAYFNGEDHHYRYEVELAKAQE